MLKFLISAALAVGAMCTSVQAASIQQTRSFTDITETTFLFDPFNPRLGKLLDIRIDVLGTVRIAAGSITGTTSVPPWSSDEPTFKFYIINEYTFGGVGIGEFYSSLGPFDPRGTLCTTAVSGETCTIDYDDLSVPFGLGGIASCCVKDIEFDDTPHEALLYFREEVLVSRGTITEPFSTPQLLSGTATLTYIFDERFPTLVPVPGALPLGLSGMALLAGLGYRRKRRG